MVLWRRCTHTTKARACRTPHNTPSQGAVATEVTVARRVKFTRRGVLTSAIGLSASFGARRVRPRFPAAVAGRRLTAGVATRGDFVLAIRELVWVAAVRCGATRAQRATQAGLGSAQAHGRTPPKVGPVPARSIASRCVPLRAQEHTNQLAPSTIPDLCGARREGPRLLGAAPECVRRPLGLDFRHGGLRRGVCCGGCASWRSGGAGCLGRGIALGHCLCRVGLLRGRRVEGWGQVTAQGTHADH